MDQNNLEFKKTEPFSKITVLRTFSNSGDQYCFVQKKIGKGMSLVSFDSKGNIEWLRNYYPSILQR